MGQKRRISLDPKFVSQILEGPKRHRKPNVTSTARRMVVQP